MAKKFDEFKMESINLGKVEMAPPSQSKTDDYDPHLHRNTKHPTSNVVALTHFLKGLIGTGMFAIPHSVDKAGYIVAPIFTILIGIMLTYCIHILIRSQYILCKRRRIPVLNYPKSMEMALEEGPQFLRQFAPYAAVTVNTFLLINQIGMGCIYIVFISTNFKAAIDSWYQMKLQYYMIILLLPLIGIMLIRNLQLLAPFSLLANVLIVLTVILVFFHVFEATPPLSDRSATGDITELPLFFGTMLFALVAIGIVPSLENSMATPKSFVSTFGVVNIGMAIVTVLYIIFGFLGYLKYGSSIQGSITLNLPQNEITAKIVQLTYPVTICISYALQCYVAVEIIWGHLISKHVKNQLLGEYAVRFGIVLFTFVVAISFANLSLFISLFGAFCLSMLGVTFPALMQICVLYPNLSRYVIVRNVILMIIGVFALITGTTKSIVDLIAHFSN